ncbi:MAG: hypothetical protein PHP32_02180 [Candidatus Izemoplasmatales bacterium]|nr:hypothetical protein [Candidatus Izemoplasmatales bacterium]
MEWNEFIVGLIGVGIGAMFGFFFDAYLLKRKMKFDISLELRKSLLELNHHLIREHSDLMKWYDLENQQSYRERLVFLHEKHSDLMANYSEFKMHVREMMAYELDSAIYYYYYQKAGDSSQEEITEKDFEFGYQALLDAYGLLISEVQYQIQRIYKLFPKLDFTKKSRIQEYLKYASRINKAFEKSLRKVIDDYVESEPASPLQAITGRLKKRYQRYLSEYINVMKDAKRRKIEY